MTPRSRAAWRRWLEQHHADRSEVWVVFYKRGTGRPTLSYDDAVEEALCFGWIDGVKRSLDAERYTHRFTPRKADSRWSETNRRRVEKLVAAGRMTPAGARLIAAAKRNGTWNYERPQLELSMPDDLATALVASPQARAFFDSLAPSYQRQFLGWIHIAKRSETRARRIRESVELLARGEKLGMR